jgi:peptide/nickel transport system substrate-binding protein
LIADAGAAGRRVEILNFVPWSGEADALSVYFAGLLETLGLKSAIRTTTDGAELEAALTSPRTQMLLFPWGPDFPAAGGILPLEFRCDGPVNVSHFCDPRLDAAMERASELQLTDPASAAAMWAEIDHDIVDQAPYVPLVNSVTLGLVSSRVENFQFNPQWGVLLDQLWVV